MESGCAGSAGSRTPELRCVLREKHSTCSAPCPGANARARSYAHRGRPAGGVSMTSSIQLSPQELQIAQLASAGLSNKEIGQQLFLSHRTIGTHLYRIFPKLGITTRAHLRDAL